MLYAIQDQDFTPVPEGYVAFIVMEKVPGIPIVDFWDCSPEKRQRIREAFSETLTCASFLEVGLQESGLNLSLDSELYATMWVQLTAIWEMWSMMRRRINGEVVAITFSPFWSKSLLMLRYFALQLDCGLQGRVCE